MPWRWRWSIQDLEDKDNLEDEDSLKDEDCFLKILKTKTALKMKMIRTRPCDENNLEDEDNFEDKDNLEDEDDLYKTLKTKMIYTRPWRWRLPWRWRQSIQDLEDEDCLEDEDLSMQFVGIFAMEQLLMQWSKATMKQYWHRLKRMNHHLSHSFFVFQRFASCYDTL